MIKGKQIENSSIGQSKFNITTGSINSGNTVTNKEYVDTKIANKASLYYSKLNLNMVANVTTGINQKACNTQVIEFPLSNILVKINGSLVDVGETKDCYFSPDGIIKRAGGLGQKADYLYWNSTKYNLAADDEINFIYLVGYYYLMLSGGTTEVNPLYNTLVVRYTGGVGETMIVSLNGNNITVGNISGQFVWDIGGVDEHIFSMNGESINVTVGGQEYIIWFDGFGSLIFSVKRKIITTPTNSITLVNLVGEGLISTSVYSLQHNNDSLYMISNIESLPYKKKLYKYSNSGDTWNNLPAPTGYANQYDYYDMCFNSLGLYMTGFYFASESDNSFNKIIRTSNDGSSWDVLLSTSQSQYPSMYFPEINFINSNVGFTFGRLQSTADYLGYIYGLFKTTNGGTNWNLVCNTVFDGSCNEMFILDENNIWMNGYKQWRENNQYKMEKRLYHVTNGGTVSTLIYQNSEPNSKNYKFTDVNTGWCYIFDSLLKTVDGGHTWNVFPINSDIVGLIHIRCIEFIGSNIIISINDENYAAYLLISNDNGSTWTSKLITNRTFYMDSGAMNIMDVVDINNITVYGKFQDFYYMPVIFKTINGGNTWEQILNKGNESKFINYSSVHFINNNVGWMVGENKAIVKSENGGTSWYLYDIELSGTTSANFNKVHFINNNIGYIIGNYYTSEPVILKTTDAGMIWEIQALPTMDMYMSTMYFLDANNGWVTGYNSSNQTVVLHTTDGGINWLIADVTVQDSYFESVAFVSPTHGFMAGYTWNGNGNSILYETLDGGATWNSVESMNIPEGGFYEMFVTSNSLYLIASDSYAVNSLYKTDNGGATWTQIMLGLEGGWVSNIEFSDNNNGTIIYHIDGQNSVLYTTSDAGMTWTELVSSRVKGSYNSVSKNYVVGLSEGRTTIVSKIQ